MNDNVPNARAAQDLLAGREELRRIQQQTQLALADMDRAIDQIALGRHHLMAVEKLAANALERTDRYAHFVGGA